MSLLLKAATGMFIAQFTLIAHAGQNELDAAKGVIMSDYTLEKCTNRQTPDDILKKQVKVLRNQGISADEIEHGFQQGMFEVEMKYPGNKKPPKTECNKAQYLYNEFLKLL